MKVLLIAVNYNSYKSLNLFLNSLSLAKISCRNYFSLRVDIVDNSSAKENIERSRFPNLNLFITPCDNLGYLGGVDALLHRRKDIGEYNYVIISNVDIIVSSTFFKDLFEVKIEDKIGWIAPRIWSLVEGRDRNPGILDRYSKKRLHLLKIMFRFPFLHRLYKRTLYKRKKLNVKNRVVASQEIYAGHGSFIILTCQFFKRYSTINYPVFLFGEEIYLAELIRKAELKVLYNPKLRVEDMEHVSTGQMNAHFYYKCHYEALSYLLKTFYE